METIKKEINFFNYIPNIVKRLKKDGNNKDIIEQNINAISEIQEYIKKYPHRQKMAKLYIESYLNDTDTVFNILPTKILEELKSNALEELKKPN